MIRIEEWFEVSDNKPSSGDNNLICNTFPQTEKPCNEANIESVSQEINTETSSKSLKKIQKNTIPAKYASQFQGDLFDKTERNLSFDSATNDSDCINSLTDNYMCPDISCLEKFESSSGLIYHIQDGHMLKCKMPYCLYTTYCYNEYLQHFTKVHILAISLPSKRHFNQ